MTEILTKAKAEEALIDPSPAGYNRNEKMAKRIDELEQKLEKLMNESEVYAVNPKSFQVDPAVQHQIEERGRFYISKADPAYKYSWVYTGQGGQMVWQKKYWGWEVVQGSMPEAMEAKKAEDTTRRIADVLLMRIRLDMYYKLEDALARKRRAVEQGSVNSMINLGEAINAKHPGSIKVHTDGTGQFASGRGPSVGSLIEQRANSGFGVHREAAKQVGEMVKDGTVPGITHPAHRGKV